MAYPTTITDVRAAVLAYSLPSRPSEVSTQDWDGAAAALDEGQAAASPVASIVKAFDALSPVLDHLDTDGLELLAGCAHLIAAHAWHGKGGDAIPVLLAATAALA